MCVKLLYVFFAVRIIFSEIWLVKHSKINFVIIFFINFTFKKKLRTLTRCPKISKTSPIINQKAAPYLKMVFQLNFVIDKHRNIWCGFYGLVFEKIEQSVLPLAFNNSVRIIISLVT